MLTRGIFAAVFYQLWRIKTRLVQKVCGKSLNAPFLPVQQNQFETERTASESQYRQEDINWNFYAGFFIVLNSINYSHSNYPKLYRIKMIHKDGSLETGKLHTDDSL